MARNYWMVKQEPESYSWDDFVKDGKTAWTGVRNFQARNHLRAMRKGDIVFFYHSVSEKRVVGVAKIVEEHYADPTADEGDWSAVEIAPVKALKTPVTLEAIKADALLREMPLIRQSRLSVLPLTADQAEKLLSLAETKL